MTMFTGQTTPSISIPFIQLINWAHLSRGRFVQEISGARYHLVIITHPDMELSSNSIFYALKNPISYVRDCYGSSCSDHTCLKYSGSCVTMFMEQKNHGISVPLMYLFILGRMSILAAIVQ